MAEVISIPTSEQMQQVIDLMQVGSGDAQNYKLEVEVVNSSTQGVFTINTHNEVIWARFGDDLKKSTDKGDTWVKTGTVRLNGTHAIGVLRQLRSGTLIASSAQEDSKIYRSTDEGTTWTQVYDWNSAGLGVGSYVLKQGMDEYPNYDGVGGNAFFIGEYTPSSAPIENKKMRIIRSLDDGVTWSVHYEEPHYTETGTRHFHFVQYDEFDKIMWAGTGDIPNHCKVFKWEGIEAPTLVGSGTYDWKMVSMAIDKNMIFCPSDRTDVGIAEIFPVYVLSKYTGKLSIIGYNDSQTWYSCFNAKYRLPFWATQVNIGVGNTSFIQIYTADYYGTYEVMRLPNTIGNSITPSAPSWSFGDYLYFQMFSNDSLNPGRIAFVRMKIIPKF